MLPVVDLTFVAFDSIKFRSNIGAVCCEEASRYASRPLSSGVFHRPTETRGQESGSGSQTWARPSRSGPIVSREFKIPDSHIPAVGPTLRFQLLPGGTHLVAEYAHRIELRRLATCSVVWSYVLLDFLQRSRYSIELVDGERYAIFIVIESSVLMKIIRIDLDTGHSAEFSRVERPRGAGYWSMQAVSGDFFLCEVGPISWPIHYFMVGNWRTETNVVLKYETPSAVDASAWRPFHIELVAGHVIFTARRPLPPHHQCVYALSMNDLLGRSPPPEGSIDIYGVPATVVYELPAAYPYGVRMMVYRSPLRHDTYKLVLYLVGNEPPPKPPAPRRYSLKSMFQAVTALFERETQMWASPTFHFSTSNNTIANWALTTAVPVFPIQYFFGIISYAGYTGEAHTDEGRVTQKFVNVHVRDPRTGKLRDIKNDAVLHSREVLPCGEIPFARSLSPYGLTRALSPYSHAVTAVQGSAYLATKDFKRFSPHSSVKFVCHNFLNVYVFGRIVAYLGEQIGVNNGAS
ncbi:hypothetical protein C8J57DRAFT_1460102 [Mycena rebaudengoi]|nr:hypothetical protein C8J57DRAFT_1460102 [Mycena rebaudengoi]